LLYESGEPVAGLEADTFRALKAAEPHEIQAWQARLSETYPSEKTLVSAVKAS
jgi:hypothetical protein